MLHLFRSHAPGARSWVPDAGSDCAFFIGGYVVAVCVKKEKGIKEKRRKEKGGVMSCGWLGRREEKKYPFIFALS